MKTIRFKQKAIYTVLTLGLLGTLVPTADAQEYCRDRTGRIVKSAAIGAGAGIAAGAISDESSILKGGLVGAGTGGVVGAIDRSDMLRDNPLARRAATGAAIGVGTNLIRDRSILSGGLIGGAAGALYHVGKSQLSDDSGVTVPNCP